MNDAGQPVHLKLNMISAFTSEATAKWAKASLKPKTVVSSDGLWCFSAVADASCIHVPTVVDTLKPRDVPAFKWVNTVLGNLKTMVSGAFKALKFRKYAQPYLDAVAYRFNHRFDLRGFIASYIVDVVKTKPVSKKGIWGGPAEAGF